jgi:beta-phosphoglucomutase-like phosphatase (HAD superfamily)
MADVEQRRADITHVIFDMDGLLLGKMSLITL